MLSEPLAVTHQIVLSHSLFQAPSGIRRGMPITTEAEKERENEREGKRCVELSPRQPEKENLPETAVVIFV